ncbi:hypothetical protein KR054_009678, partial [Drosophila jambulina]
RYETGTNVPIIFSLISAGAGVYEDGMDEAEMIQLADVMQMSMLSIKLWSSSGSNSLEFPQENELEFLNLRSGDLHSSTLIVAPPVPASNVLEAWGSPPSEPIYLTVQALVHRTMDWSPSKNEGLNGTRKRSSDNANQPLGEPGAKRSLRVLSELEEPQGDQQQDEPSYNPDATPVSVDDSGVSWEEVSLSSVSDASSMPSIGEIPSGHMVSTSSVAVSESSGSHEEASR